jgi:formyl-CoA transferase
MRLGETANADMAEFGKPLDGVRILAIEQMQSLPWATQLLARLGADVVKVEPLTGESGRGSRPAMTDPDGRAVGATFLRNNLNKRSITLNLKSTSGRDIIRRLVPRFDVLAENFKGGTMQRFGLGWDELSAIDPRLIYLSLSGFGSSGPAPYGNWPAYAPIVEAMSGIYDFKRQGDLPPVVAPAGGLGDIGTGLFGVIGVLAALRHRERTGLGQHIDVAMLDSMVAITDIVTNFWSMGLVRGDLGPLIMHAFKAQDGWFVLQVQREHQFAALAGVLGRPEWLTDPRLADRSGWVAHLEDVLRPAIEGWASTRTTVEVATTLGDNGIAAGPCFTDEQVAHDPHVRNRDMLVEVERTDGVAQPVLVPGNPIKMSRVAQGPEQRMPWLGEHTNAFLADELGLGESDLAMLRDEGTIA